MEMKKTTVLKITGAGAALFLTAALLVTLHVLPSPMDLARHGSPQKDLVIDHAMRDQVLESLIANLNATYVFPDKAKAMETALRSRQQRGEYEKIASAEEFAATLTDDLRRVSDDRHLDVGYSEKPIPMPQVGVDPDAMSIEQVEEMIHHNYGIEAVQRLPFNIGYLDLREFAPADHVAGRLGAAMTLLSQTDDLIIDLRSNNGGDPKTVELLASYLFDARTRLNDIYLRPDNRTEQSWTHDRLSGPRYGGKRKIYLLTSRDTFSAGEDFAYALKNLKRATLIGEGTGGGAHPGSAVRLNEHFGAIVPSGRSISPITHTDWEGVGVVPDIAMDADDALDHAQVMIIKDRLRTERDAFKRDRLLAGLARFD